ncbi:MAG: Unknown protein [uncultured Sulfurovum sp.]|uniref:Lipoprotein n=1 Tax=uncultured Sulfurovum sp. TaxID=269237 RepID=A0A6S6SK69_9BACT|nr:MAG: Unknown protein [uncultured Sulfurovum sp.]
MKKNILGILLFTFFVGCSHNHQINIGDIALKENHTFDFKHQEYYMSFTQEYYDNKLYPLSSYCNEQRTYLADDKFSTEMYLKVVNERTKQSRVGKYPIWFLLNDDASNISCVRKSTNFINSKPFIVNSSDGLLLKLLQKNEAKTGVPVQELSILIDFVSLLVPRTANFLLKANNIIKDPITQNYLTLMDESFEHGDLDGTKSRAFKSNVSSIKIKLYVPSKENVKRELGYLLVKPKYRTTLSTVNQMNGIPNFRFIYNSSDPQIEDLMQYELKDRRVPIKVLVDNFRQVSSEHLMEALVSLNTQLKNNFTAFDRALVLSLALRQSDFYKAFKQSIESRDIQNIRKYVHYLKNKQNPLEHLMQELKETKCEYYVLMDRADKLVRNANTLTQQQEAELARIQDERLVHQIEMQGIENFLSPVFTWKYMPEMFSKNIEIAKTTGEKLSVEALTVLYDRASNVTDYGCYVALQKPIQIQLKSVQQKRQLSIQNYLIHPNYSRGTKYDYMALSVNKHHKVDTIFYKLDKKKNLKINKILIDSSNLFINKKRIKEILKTKKVQSCSENIRRLF